MELRKATIKDVDVLIRLRLEYLLADKGFLTEEEKQVICSQLETYFVKHINQDLIAVLAEEDNNVASAAFLLVSEKPANPSFITGKTGTLLNVFTFPEHRRLGLATKVIGQLIDEAKKLELCYIDLSATPDGKKVYEKLGFIEPTSKYTPMKLQLI